MQDSRCGLTVPNNIDEQELDKDSTIKKDQFLNLPDTATDEPRNQHDVSVQSLFIKEDENP